MQELRPLLNVDDFFKKIIINKDGVSSYRNNDGILFLNIYKMKWNNKFKKVSDSHFERKWKKYNDIEQKV